MLIAVGAALFTALADSSLRAAGRWSASGKAVPRALAALDIALADQFEAAFGGAFVSGDVDAVQALVDTVWHPTVAGYERDFSEMRRQAGARRLDLLHAVIM